MNNAFRKKSYFDHLGLVNLLETLLGNRTACSASFLLIRDSISLALFDFKWVERFRAKSLAALVSLAIMPKVFLYFGRAKVLEVGVR